MEKRYLVGYILLTLGLIGITYSSIQFLVVFSSPNGLAGFLSGIMIGILLLINTGCGALLLYPGSIIVREHKSFLRIVFGIATLIKPIIILAAIIAVNINAILFTPLLITFSLASAVTLLSKKVLYGLVILLLFILLDAYIIIAL